MATPTQKHHSLVLVLCIFFIAPMFMIEAQISIPAKYDGFVYSMPPHKKDQDFISIEAFLDPVCPDSRDAWPPLKQLVHHYESSIALIVHPFPLPYHDNAFVTSRALHIVDKMNTSVTFDLLEMFFKYQDKLFYNAKTFNLSRETVVDGVSKFAAEVVGSSYYSKIQAGFKDTATDHATRISFKYGCSRGVLGTPFFFVNGFALPDPGSAIEYKKWRSIIDPLIGRNHDSLHFL